MTKNNYPQLEEVLEPVLCADHGNSAVLWAAVTLVAEALAMVGVIILDRAGKPAHGVTDKRAVMGALATYARTLAHHGELDAAIDVGEIMDRVDRLKEFKPCRR